MSRAAEKKLSANVSALQSKLGLVRSLMVRDAINDPKAIRAIERNLNSAESYIDAAKEVVEKGLPEDQEGGSHD